MLIILVFPNHNILEIIYKSLYVCKRGSYWSVKITNSFYSIYTYIYIYIIIYIYILYIYIYIYIYIYNSNHHNLFY